MNETPHSFVPVRVVSNELDPGGDSAQLRSAFVPVLLLALAVTGSLAFQTVQLVREQRQLDELSAGLLPQEQASTKLRASLDAIAAATAKLALEGNANAHAIVEQLRMRGVTIDPSKAPKPP